MRKMELVSTICDQTGLSRYVVKQVIDTCFEQIVESSKKGEAIILPGFGRFQQVPFKDGEHRLRLFPAKKTAQPTGSDAGDIVPLTGT